MWAVNKNTAWSRLLLLMKTSTASTIDCDQKEFSCGTVMRIDGRRWRVGQSIQEGQDIERKKSP